MKSARIYDGLEGGRQLIFITDNLSVRIQEENSPRGRELTICWYSVCTTDNCCTSFQMELLLKLPLASGSAVGNAGCKGKATCVYNQSLNSRKH
jgi:hypothetical protein